jgi:hypothetical protein
MAETKKKAKTSTTFTKSDLKGEPTAWTAELNNGLRMPVLGYGTYKLKEDQVGGCVRKAVDVGYKLIDTAHVYGGGKTEPAVGKALSKDKTTFVITKQWRGFHGYAETKKMFRSIAEETGPLFRGFTPDALAGARLLGHGPVKGAHRQGGHPVLLQEGPRRYRCSAT